MEPYWFELTYLLIFNKHRQSLCIDRDFVRGAYFDRIFYGNDSFYFYF